MLLHLILIEVHMRHSKAGCVIQCCLHWSIRQLCEIKSYMRRKNFIQLVRCHMNYICVRGARLYSCLQQETNDCLSGINATTICKSIYDYTQTAVDRQDSCVRGSLGFTSVYTTYYYQSGKPQCANKLNNKKQ